ncbi:hypothetical protein M1M30_gp002 [Maribacter phage Colly_1]|uniref:Uncharacterized protein n=1 Tax=Maribacter phage Colly_1 TaxID=2745691 RepID=A0A8E4UY03_9CAUD|nr:hypothetical protein M1M30_gp002 [Maribacter phage Colly_1]QQO97300.1 hypothetical protein Colly1_2 [Maribacter phage Colly_1]
MVEITRKEAQAEANAIESLKGKLLECSYPTSTMTKGRAYVILNHFKYLNRVKDIGWVVDEFVTIKNNSGYTIKVNRGKFTRRKPSAEACLMYHIETRPKATTLKLFKAVHKMAEPDMTFDEWVSKYIFTNE